MVTKRVFLAFPINPVEPVIEKMNQLRNLMADYRIRWVNSENLHLTLFFFGEMPVNQIPELRKLLRSTAQNLSPFAFSLTGPGIFKKGKEPKVLWLGIKAAEVLFEIKKEIDKSVEDLGFSSDEKTFRPHLTLGRFLPRQGISPTLENALKEAQLAEPIKYNVSELILFESRLFPEGPQYLPIEVFPLIRVC